jgi:hypothetical protein
MVPFTPFTRSHHLATKSYAHVDVHSTNTHVRWVFDVPRKVGQRYPAGLSTITLTVIRPGLTVPRIEDHHSKPIGYAGSYLAFIAGHLVPIVESLIGSSFQKWIAKSCFCLLVLGFLESKRVLVGLKSKTRGLQSRNPRKNRKPGIACYPHLGLQLDKPLYCPKINGTLLHHHASLHPCACGSHRNHRLVLLDCLAYFCVSTSLCIRAPVAISTITGWCPSIISEGCLSVCLQLLCRAPPSSSRSPRSPCPRPCRSFCPPRRSR